MAARNTRKPELPACSLLRFPVTETEVTGANQTLPARPEKRLMYFFFFLLNFNPQNIPAKKSGAVGLGLLL